ncbi:hypothetical protein MA16_Dca005050 [Dendrobium catenatum]|uniref:Tf2-1-like SH3-like domain-containing protein n=1 Tax=Dendrobium catenatum TaxID=906689 RepID=A0A2I0WGT9_9ASPA|nr:hypothetical protein MA16_Dca005050 [Dendrobium catenatum]
MLRCLVQEHPKQWEDVLGKAEFAFNAMPNRSTGKAPFTVVYTKAPNLVVDVIVLPKCKSSSATNFTEDYSKLLDDVRQQIIRSNQRYKAVVDAHRRPCNFQVGDLVMVRLRRERFPPGAYSKLAKRKIGPVPIVAKINDNAYRVELPSGCNTSSTFNVTDIWPYHSTYEAPITLSSSESSSSEAGED